MDFMAKQKYFRKKECKKDSKREIERYIIVREKEK